MNKLQPLDEIAINAVQYELIRIPNVNSATLFRKKTALIRKYCLLIVVEDELQKKTIEQEKQKIIHEMNKWPRPEGVILDSDSPFLIEVRIKAAFNDQPEELQLKHWPSFDPQLRKQLQRWGWLNSPFAHAWVPAFLVVLFVLVFLGFQFSGL